MSFSMAKAIVLSFLAAFAVTGAFGASMEERSPRSRTNQAGLAPSVTGGVVDDADTLVVPYGFTYTLDGVHNHNMVVDIAGTLYQRLEHRVAAPEKTMKQLYRGEERGAR